MLTTKIDGRDAIPVRAVPFATGGCFDAHQLIDLFYDPEAWADGPEIAGDEPMRAPPTASRVGADGTFAAVPARSWSLLRERARHCGGGAPDSPVQLRLLPAAVFVWLDEIKYLYTEFARVAETVRPVPAGAFGWDPNALLSKEEAVIVWEGFESIRRAAARRARQQRNSRATFLEKLEVEVEAIIAVARQKGLDIDRKAMPGGKADLIEILKLRDPSRAGRSGSTYSDDFSELGLRWVGGRGRKDCELFLECFGRVPQEK